MSKRPPSLKKLEAQVADWNAKYPVGQLVAYFATRNPRRDFNGNFKTRSQAFLVEGHTAAIMIDGKAGFVALDACLPIKDNEAVQS